VDSTIEVDVGSEFDRQTRKLHRYYVSLTGDLTEDQLQLSSLNSTQLNFIMTRLQLNS